MTLAFELKKKVTPFLFAFEKIKEFTFKIHHAFIYIESLKALRKLSFEFKFLPSATFNSRLYMATASLSERCYRLLH